MYKQRLHNGNFQIFLTRTVFDFIHLGTVQDIELFALIFIFRP